MATACGGGGGGVSLDDLPTELETAFCESQVECGAYPDMAACLEAVDFSSNGVIVTLQGAVDRGTVTYDSGAAADCLDGFRDQACTFSGNTGNGIDDACKDVFVGTVADGGVCVDDEECLSESCDIPSCPDACCMGACVAADPEPTIVPVGGDCSVSNTECAEGSYCKFVDPGETCTALVAENGVCEDFDGCNVGLYCDLDFMTGMGTCKRPPGQGEACEIDGFALCDRRDNYCDPVTMTCLARKAVGTACESQSECVEYAYCMATCLALPGLGDACDVDGPRSCLGDLACTSGSCVAPPVEPGCP